jgi:LacI family transcriptional regulator
MHMQVAIRQALCGGSMVTIRDVAVHCEVSPMTVSRVINGATSVHPDTRKKVEDSLQTLGYVTAAPQRTPARRSSHTIALVLPDIAASFFQKIISGVERAADAKGYRVIICNTNSDTTREQRYLKDLLIRRVDGVIIAPVNDTSRASLVHLRTQQTPFVLIDRVVPDFEADIMQTDNAQGALQLTKHLIQQGHTQIAYISGDSRVSVTRDRLYGYRMALDMAGIRFDSSIVRELDGSCLHNGYVAAQSLLQHRDRPTAIFASNSDTAIGVIRACREHGVTVPQDIALVCFDDLEHADTIFPYLTVVEQPTQQMGQLAVERLHTRCTQSVDAVVHHLLQPRLIVRTSCGMLCQS